MLHQLFWRWNGHTDHDDENVKVSRFHFKGVREKDITTMIMRIVRVSTGIATKICNFLKQQLLRTSPPKHGFCSWNSLWFTSPKSGGSRGGEGDRSPLYYQMLWFLSINKRLLIWQDVNQQTSQRDAFSHAYKLGESRKSVFGSGYFLDPARGAQDASQTPYIVDWGGEPHS